MDCLSSSKDQPVEYSNLLADLDRAENNGPSPKPTVGKGVICRRPVAFAAGLLCGVALVLVAVMPHMGLLTKSQNKAAMQLSSEEKGDPCKSGQSGKLASLQDCKPPSLKGGEKQLEEVVKMTHEVKEESKGESKKESKKESKEETSEPHEVGACGIADEDTDYVMEDEDWFDHRDHVGHAGACCDLCRAHDKCTAWTWLKDAELKTGNPGQCWMKSGKVGKRKSKAGATSGLREREETTHETVSRKEEQKRDNDCAASGASCLKSKCCKEAGHQCFTKNDYWAQCMVDCVAGPNPLDQVSPMPWACKALGNRTAGKPKLCSADGEDCTDSRCCLTGGMQCFEKNKTFAQCKPSCEPGPDMMSQDWKPWSCKTLGPRTPGAAPWVKTHCAAAGADCSAAKCCADPGMQCYTQSPYYAQCKASCKKGEKPNPWDQPWDCTPVGTRTPAEDMGDKGVATGKVAPWVPDRCKKEGENCIDAQCCQAVGEQCYAKNKLYGACKASCSTEPDPNDDNKTWTCDALGPKSIGLAVEGYPSIFCFTLYMPSRYEGELMRTQLKKGAGIFACDGYDVLSQEEDTLGHDKFGKVIKAISIPKISVGVSQDGTAGNAKLFMAVWDKIIAGQRFRYYDWTIKVDPDAVIVPWRVRTHMKPHTGENVYVVNCNKFPGSPNFPMMFGAVEIFSNLAMLAYAAGSWKCGTQLPWKSWGEDYYMTHCLDFLGVGRISDFGTLGDNLCTGANCADSYTASFHPFKDVNMWLQCWGQAAR